MNTKKTALQQALIKAVDYPSFTDEFKQYTSTKSNSGDAQSEELSNYTKLNFSRLKRLNKTLELTENIKETLVNFKQKITFLAITETWCGDAAQTIPVINKITENSHYLNFRLVYRDQNKNLINHYLTNGGEAIPIVIILDENNKPITHWGPRPTMATKLVKDFKAEHGTITDEFKKDLQIWYHKNKGVDTMNDFNKILQNINQTAAENIL